MNKSITNSTFSDDYTVSMFIRILNDENSPLRKLLQQNNVKAALNYADSYKPELAYMLYTADVEVPHSFTNCFELCNLIEKTAFHHESKFNYYVIHSNEIYNKFIHFINSVDIEKLHGTQVSITDSSMFLPYVKIQYDSTVIDVRVGRYQVKLIDSFSIDSLHSLRVVLIELCLILAGALK